MRKGKFDKIVAGDNSKAAYANHKHTIGAALTLYCLNLLQRQFGLQYMGLQID